MLDRHAAQTLATLHEGRRSHVYADSLGKLTVGIGCYLDRGGVPALFASLGIDFAAVRSGAADLTDQQIDDVFSHDLDAAIANARVDCPGVDDLPGPACLVLVDLAFQMGGRGLAAFHRMLAAIGRGDWDTAANELLDSDEARQTPVRAKSDAAILRSCASIASVSDAERAQAEAAVYASLTDSTRAGFEA